MPEPNQCAHCGDRRGFFKKILASIMGGAVVLVPALAGLQVLLDPMRRVSATSGAVAVASLDALPADGLPRKFSVIADREDAWNKFQRVPIGAIYLRRTTDGKLEALNVVCPHAGCFVDFNAAKGKFICPCHNSAFAVDGKIDDPKSPAARGLDSLEVELRNEKEVWVKFQNFEAGKAAKIPV